MTRAVSAAAVGAGVLALCLFAPAPLRAGVILAGALLASREAVRLAGAAFAGDAASVDAPLSGAQQGSPRGAGLLAGALVLLAASPGLPVLRPWTGLFPGAALILLGLVALRAPRNPRGLAGLAAAALAAVWIGLPAAALLHLSAGETGGQSLLFLLAVVMVGEAGAFVFGKLIGGPRLAPQLSPGKTWAGFVLQLLVGAGVGAGAAGVLLAPAPSFPEGALAGLFLSAAAAVGDLFASYWKRSAGAKDTGTLIPGHGGFLDRVDGTLFAAVAWMAWVAVGLPGGPG